MFACAQCNRGWKSDFLAVTPAHTDADPPRPGRVEQVLFLHPVDDDPAEHLVVEETGLFAPVTHQGSHTVDIVGLNRPSLVELRQDAFDHGVRCAVDAADPNGLASTDDLVRFLHPKHPFAAARRAGVTAGLARAMGTTDGVQAIVAGLIADAIHADPD